MRCLRLFFVIEKQNLRQTNTAKPLVSQKLICVLLWRIIGAPLFFLPLLDFALVGFFLALSLHQSWLYLSIFSSLVELARRFWVEWVNLSRNTSYVPYRTYYLHSLVSSKCTLRVYFSRLGVWTTVTTIVELYCTFSKKENSDHNIISLWRDMIGLILLQKKTEKEETRVLGCRKEYASWLKRTIRWGCFNVLYFFLRFP